MAANLLPEGLPAPAATDLDAPYWEGTAAHELRVQRCSACRTWQWGPEYVCNQCRSRDLDWVAVEPTGTIYSWERVWHPVHPALAEAVPYVIVLVELAQAGNVRMLGNLAGDPAEPVVIGTPVTAIFEDHDGPSPFTLVHWTRA